MIVNALVALGRFVDRLFDRRAVDGRWSWPPLEVNHEAPQIHGVRAGAHLSREDAHDLAAHDAEMRAAVPSWPDHGPRLGLDVERALQGMGPVDDHPSALATALEASEATQESLDRKWCVLHHGYADPLNGVDVVSHAGPAAACTWCCGACLAQCVVVGHLVPREGTEARRRLVDHGMPWQLELVRKFDERMVE